MVTHTPLRSSRGFIIITLLTGVSQKSLLHINVIRRRFFLFVYYESEVCLSRKRDLKTKSENWSVVCEDERKKWLLFFFNAPECSSVGDDNNSCCLTRSAWNQYRCAISSIFWEKCRVTRAAGVHSNYRSEVSIHCYTWLKTFLTDTIARHYRIGWEKFDTVLQNVLARIMKASLIHASRCMCVSARHLSWRLP